MSKKEENLFWFYRGQRDSDAFSDIQLENNFTKALFIVLKNCTSFRSAFLSKFLKVSNKGEIRFEMQKNRPHGFDPNKKSVLLILSDKLPQLNTIKTKKQTSIPDGWIITKNENVLVEVKITGKVSEDQLKRHEKLLGKTTKRVSRTWEDLAIFLNDEKSSIENEVERFLLNQFTAFLEAEGMTKFNGFNEEDLNYFKSDNKDKNEARDALRRKFTNFKDAITRDRHLPRHLKPAAVGALKTYSESIWFPMPLKKTPYFNICVVLELEELSITLSSPLHHTSDGVKFVKSLNDRQANIVKFFKNHQNLKISLYKREEGKEKENWKRYDLWTPVQIISVEMLNAGIIDVADIRKQFEKIDNGELGKSRAGINIKYSIPRSKLFSWNEKKTIEETVKGIKIMDQLARKIIGNK